MSRIAVVAVVVVAFVGCAGPAILRGPFGAKLQFDEPSERWKVASVVPGSAAAEAGLAVGDEVVEVDGFVLPKPVHAVKDGEPVRVVTSRGVLKMMRPPPQKLPSTGRGSGGSSTSGNNCSCCQWAIHVGVDNPHIECVQFVCTDKNNQFQFQF